MKKIMVVCFVVAAVITANYKIVKPVFFGHGVIIASDVPEETTEPHSPEEDASDTRGC